MMILTVVHRSREGEVSSLAMVVKDMVQAQEMLKHYKKVWRKRLISAHVTISYSPQS